MNLKQEVYKKNGLPSNLNIKEEEDQSVQSELGYLLEGQHQW